MRTFAVVGHLARTDGDFTLDDLPGSGGRFDLLCRCVQAALSLSHTLRRDTECYLILQGEPVPPRTLVIRGGEVRSFHPDERSTAALLRKALSLPVGMMFRPASPGIYVRAAGLETLLAEQSFVLAEEEGEDIRDTENLPMAFLLSDHLNFTDEERDRFSVYPRVSVGPRSLHADQAITLIHNELDRREAGWN
ncbi:MAG: tRNA (pseudouridine(54)-N(1))-methyltransferase TrmY [Methanomicrobiales archaeon]|nr:tRNA (pseudouridine(54)-N(1))-methyltransferase TrmY [Methanomicrobiales archaeon]